MESSYGTEHRDHDGSELNLALPREGGDSDVRVDAISRDSPESTTMSAERGGIGEPQPPMVCGNKSRASAGRDWVEAVSVAM